MIIIFEVTAILPVGPWSKEEGTKKEKKNYLRASLKREKFGQKIDLKSIWVKIDFTLPLNENTQKNKNTTKLPPFQLP